MKIHLQLYFLFGCFLSSLAMFGCNSTSSPIETANDSTTNTQKLTGNSPTPANPSLEKDSGTVSNQSEQANISNRTEKAKPQAGKGNVQGTVFAEGKPAEGIEVALCEKRPCIGQSYTAKTDKTGVYVFANVEPRKYEALIVKASHHAVSYEGIIVEADKTNFFPDTNTSLIFKPVPPRQRTP